MHVIAMFFITSSTNQPIHRALVQFELEQLCMMGYPPENIKKLDQGKDACSLSKRQKKERERDLQQTHNTWQSYFKFIQFYS
jgi:hypothetical protein